MIALLVGVVLLLFAVYSVLPVPWSMQWWSDVMAFLKGAIPVAALLIGLIALFVGFADIKDKMEAKKEEREAKEAEAAEAASAGGSGGPGVAGSSS
jgi:TRAP-type C4-dicarboxylate transport system permease small subunit